jgi:predicted ATPase/class 3 adenylate cyclase
VQPQSAVTTYLFTDIQGSTRLWELEPERMRQALACHDAMTCATIENHRGVIVKMIGDGAQAAFDNPLDAVCAAVQLQLVLADPEATFGMRLQIRCGVHAGIAEHRDNDFFGRSVNRAARITDVAHGGQVLVSQTVATLVGDCLPGGIALRDLGSVRLRDLERPERVYQVLHPDLRDEFPPLRSLEATPNNLPVQVSSFIGRERELVDIKRLLGQTRLLTLVGPGGIGKTRLSLQASAESMDGYSDGVWFVGLAPLTDARLVPQALASVLGVKEDARRPVLEAVLNFVKDRRMLIILDNCEHLAQSCSELAVRLLESCPRLSILASSREPLHVAGETTYPLQSLPTPDTGQTMTGATLIQFEAARLFIDRVIAVQPNFQITQQDAQAVADICHRLEGIPLAIELAAGRARVLSVGKIAERLSDRFRLLTRGDKSALPRQQTMRASIDWSYDLLTEAERALLRRLAMFAGGWTLEAAEAVGVGPQVAKQDVLDLLSNLVEKSLIIADTEGGRYRFLETVRQYAQERLIESGEDGAARASHLAFYLTLAEDAEPKAGRPKPQVWFAHLDVEWGNLLAAFESCARVDGGAKAGLRLACAIKNWIVSRGFLAPGYRLTVEAIQRDGAQERDLARCRALLAAFELGFLTGRYQEASAYAEESLAIAREIDDPIRVAEAHRLLGYVCIAHRQLVAARDHFETSLALSRDLKDKSLIAIALNGLGELYRTQREPDQARPFYEEAVTLDREVGDQRCLAIHLCNLSSLLIESGLEQQAPKVMLEALSIAAQIGSKQIGHAVLGYCAGLAVLRRQWSLAGRLYGAAENLARQMGYHREPMDEAFLPCLIARAREALGEAEFSCAEGAGRALSYEQAVGQARRCIEGAD